MPESLRLRDCLAHLWKWLRPNRIRLFLGLGLVIVTCFVFMLMPLVEGQILNQLQSDLKAIADHVPGAKIQMGRIGQILLLLFCIFLVKISSQCLSAVFLTDAIQNSMAGLRNAVEQKINRLPVSYFDSHKTGDLLSKITNDIETVSNALQQTLSRILSAIVSCTLYACMMFMISRVLFAIVISGLLISGALSLLIVRRSQPIFDRQQAALSELNSTINEMYSGLSQIMIYNRQDFAQSQFEAVNSAMRRQSFLAQSVSGLISPLTSMVTYMVIACAALYGCLQILSGTLMLGELQAFIRYIWNINDPISQLSQLSNAVQSAFSGMNRLFSFLDLEEVQPTVTRSPIETVHSIDFDHIEFSYTDQPLMKDVSFHVRKHQTVAVVGHTGAGKTTLSNLLLRFYPLKSGSISINGENIEDLSYEDLRSLCGLVLQDPWLFEGTIAENLAYARDGITPEQMQRAISIARLDETIEALPEGLQTRLEENAQNLSQGEKQLLTIARALLKDPQILILDEATSSVDTRLEKRLQEAMESVMADRTCFVIAHRLSTILNADLILVMDHGDLIESGTHAELLEKGGHYARLYRSQFQEQT